MKKINELMKDINEISQIQFKLKGELGDIYISPSFLLNKCNEEMDIEISGRIYTIEINKNDKNALPLLSSYIKNNIEKLDNKKNLPLQKILNKAEIRERDIEESYEFLFDKFDIIIICVNENIEEVYEIVRECYNHYEIPILKSEDRIYVFGVLEDVKEHAESLNDILESNISSKARIGYSSCRGYKEVNYVVDSIENKIKIAHKYGSSRSIFTIKDLLFEEMVDSMSEVKKDYIIKIFNKGLKKIDAEMVKTIEMFFYKGLNLSEASKELFIHRNTLIYRLDKVQKYTGFDIRDFNQAVMFKIIFTLWKEKNKLFLNKNEK